MEQKKPFNPHDHVTQIKTREGSKDYLPVQYRLVWFREQYPHGSIETEMLHLDVDKETEEETFGWNSETRRSERITKRAQGFVVFRATVKDGEGGVAHGTKSEKAASFPDYIEKCETGAIGRALAALGFGTQFAPELNEEHRIVDTPVEQSRPTQQVQATNKQTTPLPPPQQSQQENQPTQGKVEMASEELMKQLQAYASQFGDRVPSTMPKDLAEKKKAAYVERAKRQPQKGPVEVKRAS